MKDIVRFFEDSVRLLLEEEPQYNNVARFFEDSVRLLA